MSFNIIVRNFVILSALAIVFSNYSAVKFSTVSKLSLADRRVSLLYHNKEDFGENIYSHPIVIGGGEPDSKGLDSVVLKDKYATADIIYSPKNNIKERFYQNQVDPLEKSYWKHFKNGLKNGLVGTVWTGFIAAYSYQKGSCFFTKRPPSVRTLKDFRIDEDYNKQSFNFWPLLVPLACAGASWFCAWLHKKQHTKRKSTFDSMSEEQLENRGYYYAFSNPEVHEVRNKETSGSREIDKEIMLLLAPPSGVTLRGDPIPSENQVSTNYPGLIYKDKDSDPYIVKLTTTYRNSSSSKKPANLTQVPISKIAKFQLEGAADLR